MGAKPKVLIAYDGSEASDAALEDLPRAGLGPEGEARVLAVADVWIPPLDSLSVAADVWTGAAFPTTQKRDREALKDAKFLAKKGAARLGTLLPRWKISAVAVADAAAQGILSEAERWRPDLLSVGSRGHSALGRLLLGSVAHKVLTHAPCTVRVARPGPRRPGPPRVLLGVDGSPESVDAVRAAVRRPWPKEAEFRIVVVLDYRLSLAQAFQAPAAPPGTVRGRRRAGEPSGTFADRLAEMAATLLAERGRRVTHVVREGDPRRELAREAKRFRADSLFVGHRGLGGMRRLFLGSVSLALAEKAPCSVEVVRKVPA